MASGKTERHGWLRSALTDAGLQQTDVARAWGSDDSIVSRFIKSGSPALTWDRAMTLAAMLNMPLDELRLRLNEGVAPVRRKGVMAPVALPAASREAVLAELRAAVAKARAALPNSRIDVKISHGEEEL